MPGTRTVPRRPCHRTVRWLAAAILWSFPGCQGETPTSQLPERDGDTAPPLISEGLPNGVLASGTTQVTMRVTTNEPATCKWGPSPGTAYPDLANAFDTTGGPSHATVLTALSDGQSYTRYVGCQDEAGNATSSAYSISFSVDRSATTGEAVDVPSSGDWTNRGVALTPAVGSWDARLTLGTPASILKIDSIYYLYYVGSDGSRADGGPSNRAIGLATSTDGITWARHPGNPIIPYAQLNRNGDDEEGAWRLTAFLDVDGTVVMYVTELFGSRGSVGGNVFLWTSSDGVHFTNYEEPNSVWGGVIEAGALNFPGSDEFGVLGAERDAAGRVHVHYIAKGTESWNWAHTAAENRIDFLSGALLLDLASNITNGSNPIAINQTEWLHSITTSSGEIRLFKTADLGAVGTLEEIYGNLPGATQAGRGNFALYLDREAGTWFLLVAVGNQGDDFPEVRVLTAPVRLTGGN